METLSELPARCEWNHPGPRFNIKMSSYQYRKSHCGDKTVVRLSYLHNGISYTGKMTSLYWFSPLVNMLKAKSILYTLIDSLCTLWSHSIMHELKTRNLIDIFSIERDFIVKNSEIVSKLFILTHWNVSTTNGMILNYNLINFLPPAQSPLNAPHFTIHNTFAPNLKRL